MRLGIGPFVVALVLVGCGIVNLGEGGEISADQLGPVFARPGEDGPPIECRGLDRDHCLSPGTINDTVPGFDFDEIHRVIVSCIGRCSSESGEFQIDIVVDGGTRSIGRGAYGGSDIGP
jgi:hypothetical protein